MDDGVDYINNDDVANFAGNDVVEPTPPASSDPSKSETKGTCPFSSPESTPPPNPRPTKVCHGSKCGFPTKTDSEESSDFHL